MYPYRCRNCFRTLNKFYFGFRFWLQLVVLIAAIAGAGWVGTSIVSGLLRIAPANHAEAAEGAAGRSIGAQ